MADSLRTRYPAFAKAPRALEDEPQLPEATPASPLDGETHQAEFRKLQEWWLQARESQALPRMEMEIDECFYHGDQFTDEDRAALEAVGQAPLVFNKTKPVVDWIVGTERRTRVDFNVLPRKKDTEDQAALKKDVLKYLSDVNRAPYARSQAFKQTSMSGLGWIEVGARNNGEEEPIFYRHEDWRNVWYDPLGNSLDTTDWRYIFRSKWTDLDIAKAMFPNRAPLLETCATSVGVDLTTPEDDEFYLGLRYSRRDSNGNYIGQSSYVDVVHTQVNNRRERVRLVEAWYRKPVRAQRVRGGKHHNRILNTANEKMLFEVNRDLGGGLASVYDATVMRVRCAVFCENVLLEMMDTPYHHNRFPFVPVWGYRKGKYHEPYGVVRNCRSPQEDLNKRYSKALFLLSSTRIIADRNAVQDWEEIRSEVGRPDAQLLLDKHDARFEIHTEKELAEEQVKLMHNDGMHIMESAGVTPENLGRDTNAMSGKAVLAKQTQGSVVSAELFDNLRLATQLSGELLLSVAEQFMDEAKAIRVAGERGGIQWREINQPSDDGQVLNDITATQMDFVVSEQDFRDTTRQAMFETLGDMISKMDPQVALNLLDAVVDLTDFPGKKELIERIRKLNGHMPSEAEMTPEQKEEAQEAAQQKQKQEQIKEEAVILDLEEKRAKVAKLKAEAELAMSKAGQSPDGAEAAQLREEMIDVQNKAAQTEQKLTAQIEALKVQAANKREEIASRERSELLKARMKADVDREKHQVNAQVQHANAKVAADAQVQAADINADVNYQLGLDGLNREVEQLETKAKDTQERHKDQLKAQKQSLAKPAEKKKPALTPKPKPAEKPKPKRIRKRATVKKNSDGSFNIESESTEE